MNLKTVLAMLALTCGGMAAEITGDADSSVELAKKLSNPIASLVSVPFQNNFLFNVGSGDGFRATTNIQPVIPFKLDESWNLISRTILPVTYQEGIFSSSGKQFGLGDTLQSLFFSPTSSDVAIWGIGPAFLLSTATDDLLGGGKWGSGPTGVVLKQSGPWTYGILANHIWSFAGDHDRSEVSSTYLQPFLNYTTQSATTFSLNTESSYDWQESQWTAPFNAGVSQLIKFGDQPVSIGLQGTWYAAGPSVAPDWGVRLIFTFLFPKN
jgi:hypothetical protein